MSNLPKNLGSLLLIAFSGATHALRAPVEVEPAAKTLAPRYGELRSKAQVIMGWTKMFSSFKYI